MRIPESEARRKKATVVPKGEGRAGNNDCGGGEEERQTMVLGRRRRRRLSREDSSLKPLGVNFTVS